MTGITFVLKSGVALECADPDSIEQQTLDLAGEAVTFLRLRQADHATTWILPNEIAAWRAASLEASEKAQRALGFTTPNV